MSADDPPDLVMPFVTVRSNGGPHDDDAYTCGWECGFLDATLAMHATLGTPGLDRMVHAVNVAQADLIAMRNGYRIEHRYDDSGDGFVWLELVLCSPED